MPTHEHFTTNALPTEIEIRPDATIRAMDPENDASRIHEILLADPQIQNRVIWTNRLNTEQMVSRMIALRSRSTAMMAITTHEKVAGYLGLWEDDEGYFDGQPHPYEYGFGYFLDPAERGKGLVTDAARALMKSAEATFDVQNWAVYVEDNNTESQAVLKRLAFEAAQGQGGQYIEPRTGVLERKWERAPGE